MAWVEIALGNGEMDGIEHEIYILIGEYSNLAATVHDVVGVDHLLFLWWCQRVRPGDRWMEKVSIRTDVSGCSQRRTERGVFPLISFHFFVGCGSW